MSPEILKTEESQRARVGELFRDFLQDPDEPDKLLWCIESETDATAYRGSWYYLPGYKYGRVGKYVYSLEAKDKEGGKDITFRYERRGMSLTTHLAVNNRLTKNPENWEACEQALSDAISGVRVIPDEAR
jgi:hypothetical protein